MLLFAWGETIGKWIIKNWFDFVWNIFVIGIGTIILMLLVIARRIPVRKGASLVWRFIDRGARMIMI